MRSVAVAGLVFAAILAGCVDGAETPDDAVPAEGPTIEQAATLSTVVYDARGQLLAAEAFGAPLPTMRQSLVDDVYSWEPSMGVGPDGTAYYRSANAIAEPPRGYLYKTEDGGGTWQDVTPKAAGVVPEPAFTGDPFVHVDPDTGRIFYYDQQSHVVCNHWGISDDKGATWETWDTCQEDASYGDHPAITTGIPRSSTLADYPNVVYFCASIGGDSSCRVSLDGGFTYGPAVQSIKRCVDEDGNEGPSQHGHARTGADGKVYVAKAACNHVLVGISKDDGKSWRTVHVNNTGWTEQKWPEYNEHEASVAADAAGNIYVAVVADDGLTNLVVSRDGGASWSEPVTVSRPEVTATNFAHIVAGQEGGIAILYVGSTVDGGYDASANEMEDAPWNAYVAFSRNAHETEPVFASTMINDADDPVHRGPCGGRCPVREGPAGRGILQPGMYDFLDIDVDPSSGMAWAALVDLCHDACTDGTGSGDEGKYSVAAAGVQTEGMPLLDG